MEIATFAAAVVTIGIFSFLYRDNSLYRVTEHLLIGLSVGFTLVLLWNSVLMPKLIIPLFVDAQFWGIIPLALSLLMLLRLKSSLAYLSRPVLALVIGAGAGVSIPAMFEARILRQMSAAIEPFANVAAGTVAVSIPTLIGMVVSLVGVITVMVYFFYTRPDTRAVNGISRIGIYFLMVFFGATFGYTVASRLTLLIGRIEFLLGDFLHVL
jgi:hypothetical protein